MGSGSTKEDRSTISVAPAPATFALVPPKASPRTPNLLDRPRYDHPPYRRDRVTFVMPQHPLSLALCFPELLEEEFTFGRLQRAQGLLIPNLSDDATLHILSFLTPVRVSTMLRCSKAFFITVLRLTPNGIPSVPQHICITQVPYWVSLPQDGFNVPTQNFTLACTVKLEPIFYACSTGREKRCIVGRNDYFSFGTMGDTLLFTSFDRKNSHSEHKLPRSKWIYLACVCTTDAVTFYIDGKQLDTVPFAPLNETKQGPACVGGLPAPSYEYWQGGLAWVHVVPQPLEGESQIRELFKVGYEGRKAGWFPELTKAEDWAHVDPPPRKAGGPRRATEWAIEVDNRDGDLVWKKYGTQRGVNRSEQHHIERGPHPLWQFSWESTFVTSRGVFIKQVIGGGWW